MRWDRCRHSATSAYQRPDVCGTMYCMVMDLMWWRSAYSNAER